MQEAVRLRREHDMNPTLPEDLGEREYAAFISAYNVLRDTVVKISPELNDQVPEPL